jgi:hypothetical protein
MERVGLSGELWCDLVKLAFSIILNTMLKRIRVGGPLDDSIVEPLAATTMRQYRLKSKHSLKLV